MKILALYGEPSGAVLPQVLEQALALRCFSLEGVRLLLHQHHQSDSLPAPLALATSPRLAALARVDPPPPNLSLYDQLLDGRQLATAMPVAGGES